MSSLSLWIYYVLVLSCTFISPLIIVINLCSTEKSLRVYLFTGETKNKRVHLNVSDYTYLFRGQWEDSLGYIGPSMSW